MCFQDLNDHCTAFIICKYRVLWLELSELLQSIGNAYARTYATYSLFMLTNITIAVSKIFFEIWFLLALLIN